MGSSTRRFTIYCAIALVSGLAVGLSIFRPVSFSGEDDADKPAATKPAQAHRMPFVATDFDPQELATIGRLADAARAGGIRLQSILEELDQLEETERDQLLAELIPRLGEDGLANLLVALEDSGGFAEIMVTERLVKLDADQFFKIAKARGESWNFLPMVGYIFLASVDPQAARERLERDEEDAEEIAEYIAIGKSIQSTAAGVAWFRVNCPDEEEADFADLIESIGLTDPGQTLDEVLKIESSESRVGALEALFSSWALSEPAAAFAAARGLEDDGKLLSVVLAEWARYEPEAAIARAFGSGQQAAVLGGWVETDPLAAAVWAGQNLEGEVLADFLLASGRSLPAGAARSLLDQLPAPERQQIFLAEPVLLAQLANTDLQMAIAEAQNLPAEGKEASETGKNFGSLVAHDDLARAMQIGETLPQGALKEGLVEAIAYEGGRADPAATLEWLEAQTLDARQSAEWQLYSSWSDVDPQAALQAARERGAGGDTIGRIVEQWIKHADAALVFESVRGDFLGSPQIQSAMTDAWLKQDPSTGVDLLMANNAAGEMDLAIIGLLKSWAQSDAQEASEYVREQIPTGPLRTAVEEIAPE